MSVSFEISRFVYVYSPRRGLRGLFQPRSWSRYLVFDAVFLLVTGGIYMGIVNLIRPPDEMENASKGPASVSVSAGDVVMPLRSGRCQANVAHIRQPRPDSGLGVQVKVLQTLQVVPSSLGSGPGNDFDRRPNQMRFPLNSEA